MGSLQRADERTNAHAAPFGEATTPMVGWLEAGAAAVVAVVAVEERESASVVARG